LEGSLLSNYNNLSRATLIELRIAESSLRSELKNPSHPASVRKEAQKNLQKILKEIAKKDK